MGRFYFPFNDPSFYVDDNEWFYMVVYYVNLEVTVAYNNSCNRK